MKIIHVICMLTIAAMLGLTGCTAGYQDKTGSYKLPPEMQGFKVYRIESIDGNSLYVVVRTNTVNPEIVSVERGGKSPARVVIIDGESYIRVEKVEK